MKEKDRKPNLSFKISSTILIIYIIWGFVINGRGMSGLGGMIFWMPSFFFFVLPFFLITLTRYIRKLEK